MATLYSKMIMTLPELLFVTSYSLFLLPNTTFSETISDWYGFHDEAVVLNLGYAYSIFSKLGRTEILTICTDFGTINSG